MKALIVGNKSKLFSKHKRDIAKLGNCDCVDSEIDAIRYYSRSLKNCEPYCVILSYSATLVSRLRRLERVTTGGNRHIARMMVVSGEISYYSILDAFEMGADSIITNTEVVATCKQINN